MHHETLALQERHRSTFQRTHKISSKRSDPASTKCREGCASDIIKICTALQRKRSGPHKVPRGLRKYMFDFNKTLRAPRKMNIEKVKNDVLPRSQPLLCQGLQSTAPATKYCNCHTESSPCPKWKMTTVSQSKTCDLWPFQNVVQVHQIYCTCHKMTSKTTSHFDPHLPTF